MMKYDESRILDEIEKYIKSTYGEHYVGPDGVQIQDLLQSIGSAEEFCRGSVIKYIARWGKKKGRNRLDLLKAAHYIVLLMHFSAVSEKREELDIDDAAIEAKLYY